MIFVARGVSAQNGLDCTSPASSFVSKVSSWIYHSRCPFLLENIDKTKRGPSRFLSLEIDIAAIFPFEGAIYVFDTLTMDGQVDKLEDSSHTMMAQCYSPVGAGRDQGYADIFATNNHS